MASEVHLKSEFRGFGTSRPWQFNILSEESPREDCIGAVILPKSQDRDFGAPTRHAIDQFDADRKRFQALAARWAAERGPESSVARISMNSSYQQIIGMGEKAIPFILQELRRQSDHWFWALRAITGEDPTPENGRGIMREMAAAWLDWGDRHGYPRDKDQDRPVVSESGGSRIRTNQ